MTGKLKRSDSGEEVELQAVSIIGRSSECEVILPDPRVSQRHAMILKQDGGFYLFDLGSFNGSYLNGSRVTATRQLSTGDVLTFAEHDFTFQQTGGEVSGEDLDNFGGSTIALIRSTPVIILVSDIMGFTTLSEEVEADDLAQIIGSWYSDCERILSEEGGTVDKFIGDSVLAYWTKVDDSTLMSAVRTAQKLLTSCEKIYQSRPDVFNSIDRPFEIGVAIHTGKVAYGGMSQGEFTLVGDPVNLTFRLENLTRNFEENVLLSGDFARMVPDLKPHLKSLGVHKVKGRAQGVEVVAMASFPEE
ncbi:MAG: adenylate/guanylate cyclase domain-containing protein [Verrucomicrobiales bacterium]|nr:adenylate/guanylate cyclase domain-containing protein [Verrucomicrobiales bacterium]